MVENIECLTVEVQKIINAPFLVSLKRLHTILCHNNIPDDTDLVRWAQVHQSEVRRLAPLVAHALSHWSYSFDIVAKLSRVTVFRDALLDFSPALLSQLLGKAVESDEGFDRYANVCLNLLREPLESHCALPESAQTLLWRYFENAMKEPDAATVEPVYILLDGACQELLGLLPTEGLETLRGHLTKIMRTVKRVEEQLVSLFSLAIISKTVTPRRTSSNSMGMGQPERDQVLGQECAMTFGEVGKFFVGEKAAKTIHLLALQVIYACRDETEISDSQRLKPVRLARQILSAIGRSNREHWAQENLSIVRKLIDKATLEHLPKALQLEALAFSCLLLQNDSSVYGSFIACFQRLLLAPHCIADAERHIDDVLAIIIPLFARHIDQAHWKEYFLLYVEGLRGTGKPLLHTNGLLSRSLPIILRTCLDCSATRVKIVGALSSDGFYESIESLTSQNTSNCTLLSDFLAAVLNIGVSRSGDEPALPPRLASRLIGNLQELAHKRDGDVKSQGSAALLVHSSIIEQECSPEQLGASHQWQARLAYELGNEAKHRHESIIRFVGSLCRDFEERCEHVEAPLRAKQAEFDDMKAKYERLRTLAGELEGKNHECEASITALKSCTARADEGRANTETELSAMTEKYRQFEERAEEARLRSEEELLELRRELDDRKLEFQVAIARHTEAVDEKSEEIIILKDRLDTVRSEAQARQEQDFNNQASLEDTLSTAAASLASEKTTNEQLKRSLEQSDEYQTGLESKIDWLEGQIKEISDRMEKVAESHEATVQGYEVGMAETRTKHEDEMRKAQSDADDQRQKFDREREDTKKELASVRENYESRIKEQRQEIEAVHDRLKLSEEDCRGKADQLQQAQQMRSRLMTAMGLSDDTMAPVTNEKYNEKNQPSQKEKGQSDTQAEPDSLGVERQRRRITKSATISSSRDMSFSKRARSRPTFQLPIEEWQSSQEANRPLTRARGRLSMEVRGLRHTTLQSLNQANMPRRKSENPNSLGNFLTSSTKTDTEEEQRSEEAVPGDQENMPNTLSTGDYFEGIVTDDFEGSTVEL